MSQDPFAGGKEVKQEKFAFGKPGDWIKGTYTGSKTVKTTKGLSVIYELKGLAGEFHPVHQDEMGNNIAAEQAVMIDPGEFYAIWGGKETIDQGFRKTMLGQIVGLQFVEFVKSNTPGNKPWKRLKFVQFDMDPDFKGESSDAVSQVFAGAEEVPFQG